ncbi:putative GNAT family acetyltransferase [Kribbella rubisoli]|uniref:GNAT family acetyltransferase n=1 Tax=Kribbella rubisoli TaxID=3075929 RepID=A0A4Q7WVB3_9ACTN|nr:GNAT family N-acetyltransferase [Kribbella rubisoli]RZU13998.1 putative GNAT family acetyltransferase [Kribbella rubisoli]
MTDQVVRPDGTGFSLAGGELTVAGADGGTVDASVSARLLDGFDVTLASRSTADPGDVRSEGGRSVLALETRPMMLNSLPSSVRVRLHTDAAEGDWRLILRFRNHAGSSLTWQAELPTEAFDAGWEAPLADLLTIDRTADEPAPQAPAVSVVHHPEDEYYELLVDGQQAGLLVYHVIGSHLSITHTVIEPTYRGRGLSWALVGGSLDDIRTKYPTVMNYCPVVSRFVEKNPSYGDLLSQPRRV